MKPQVLIGIPTYDGRVNIGTFDAISDASKLQAVGGYHFVKSSLLTKCFNQLWCHALNNPDKITHFCMLHADILPEPGWLDRMLEIMEEHAADVLSVVIPMKSQEGLTSTAIENVEDCMRPSRFTVRQLATLPKTFTHPKLLVNTGLMLVDFQKPWVEEICFEISNRISRVGDKFEALALSEDWDFSVQAKQNGAKIFATSAVAAHHVGELQYSNQGAWGTLEVDKYHGEARLEVV